MAWHPCPGGCGARCPVHHYACRSCWFRLPARLRKPIADNFRVDLAAHSKAMKAAQDWYDQNPPRNVTGGTR